MQTKLELRQLIKNTLARMTQEEKTKESEIVCKKCIAYLQKNQFDTLVTYNPLPDEVDISAVNEWAKSKGMTIIQISKNGVLDGRLKIEDGRLIIVPGRAFTIDGKRLGRGGGYYDQLLAKYPDIPTIGVCFACQLLDDLPQDPWDKKVSKVVNGML